MEAVLSVAPFSAPCVLSFGSVYVGAVAERTVRVANPTEAAVVVSAVTSRRTGALAVVEDRVRVPARSEGALTVRWVPEATGVLGKGHTILVRLGKGRTLPISVDGVAKRAEARALRVRHSAR